MELEKLFFELTRVAIGTQDHLTRLPSEAEWEDLYDIAVKQSLVGICFCGLQNLGADADEGFTRIGMSEELYLNWMGLAAQINMTNETVNQQCVALQKRLSSMGYRSCILKGQANLPNYNIVLSGESGAEESDALNDLAMMRQSGDIDIWVEGGRKKVVDLVNSICPTKEIRETHAQLCIFDETAVEVHYRPGLIRDFRRNRRLQAFFRKNADECFTNRVKLPCGEIVAPTVAFNAVQQLLHIYHHLFDSGIGLRQVMDYYFVLMHLKAGEKDGVMKVLKSVGVERFARALMYVERVVFGMEDGYMLCEPSEKDGEYLLGEILESGNFGHYDKRKKRHKKHSFLRNFFGVWSKNFRHSRFAPMDWFWSPLWRLYYFFWRKWNGYE